MKNFIQPGDVLDLVMPYDRLSGQGVLVGGLFGVCQGDALSGVTQAVKRTGVYTMNKLSTDVFTAGLAVYWDDTNKRCTLTATSNWFVGWSQFAAANPSSTFTLVLANVSKAAG